MLGAPSVAVLITAAVLIVLGNIGWIWVVRRSRRKAEAKRAQLQPNGS
jgi:uncharacterized membrane protein YqjE